MAYISNQQVVSFSNTQIRPMAERLVVLRALVDDIMQEWYAQIAPILIEFADDDIVNDGRASEGVSRITKADLTNFCTQLSTIKTQFDGAGVMDVLSKPAVRSLSDIM